MGFRVSPGPPLHSPLFSTGVRDIPEPDISQDNNGRHSTSDTQVRRLPNHAALSLYPISSLCPHQPVQMSSSPGTITPGSIHLPAVCPKPDPGLPLTLPCSQLFHDFPAPSSRENSELSPGIKGPNPPFQDLTAFLLVQGSLSLLQAQNLAILDLADVCTRESPL